MYTYMSLCIPLQSHTENTDSLVDKIYMSYNREGCRCMVQYMRGLVLVAIANGGTLHPLTK